MKTTRDALRGSPLRGGHALLCLVAFAAVVMIVMAAGASVMRSAFKDTRHSKTFWHQATARPTLLRHGVKPVLELRTTHVQAFTLNRSSQFK